MSTKLITAFIICALPVIAFGQKTIVDSIQKRISTEKNDSEIVRLYVYLGNKAKYFDTALSSNCARKIDSIATKTGIEFFRGEYYLLKGIIPTGYDNNEALDYTEKAKAVFAKYPNNRRIQLNLASALINIGGLHYQSDDYAVSVEHYLQAEEIYLKYSPLNSDLSIIYSSLSKSYSVLNKHEEAITISKKNVEFSRTTRDKQLLAAAMLAYGNTLVDAKKGDICLKVLDSALALGKEIDNVVIIYSANFLEAAYYFNNKVFNKAMELYNVCLSIAIKNNYMVAAGLCYLNLAGCEIELKQINSAVSHMDSASKYYNFSDPSDPKLWYFQNYSEIYRTQGKYDKALAYRDSVVAIKDSIYQRASLSQMEFRHARYNYEAKQQEVDVLQAQKELQALTIKQKNTLNYILIASAIMLLLFSYLLFRNYKNKQQLQQQRINELETEKQLAATEAVLKGEEQERTRLAKDLHDGLGGMLSGIKYSLSNMKGNLIVTPDNAQAFERSIDMLDSSIQEMRRVAHNMMPEALVKFGLDTALKDFCNDINQSGALKVRYQSLGLENIELSQTTSITLYRIVQELVNNVLKHANAKSLIVQLSKTDGQISITVEDDGQGFDTSILQRAKGIGWSNIQHRIEYVKGTLDVQSEPNKGTSVHIEIPET